MTSCRLTHESVVRGEQDINSGSLRTSKVQRVQGSVACLMKLPRPIRDFFTGHARSSDANSRSATFSKRLSG